MSVEKPEIGIVCSCGFRRRATQINDDGTWNGREIQGLHYYQVEKEAAADRLQVEGVLARGEGNAAGVVRTHNISMGLIADMTWPAVTNEEQQIGEAWQAGYREGASHTRDRIKIVLQTQLDELKGFQR